MNQTVDVRSFLNINSFLKTRYKDTPLCIDSAPGAAVLSQGELILTFLRFIRRLAGAEQAYPGGHAARYEVRRSRQSVESAAG